jgi:hypothetical protein
MKLLKTVLISVTILTTLVSNNNHVQAANFALSLGEEATPEPNTNIAGICSTLNQCKPNDLITVSAPAGTSSRYVRYDINFDITKAVFTILPNQDIVWNPASKYSFFNKQEISPDGKTLTFSEGAIKPGTVGLFTRVNDIPITFTVLIEGKQNSVSVIEPSTILGTGLVLVWGTLLRFRKRELQ